jgi:hypothetical protein
LELFVQSANVLHLRQVKRQVLMTKAVANCELWVMSQCYAMTDFITTMAVLQFIACDMAHVTTHVTWVAAWLCNATGPTGGSMRQGDGVSREVPGRALTHVYWCHQYNNDVVCVGTHHQMGVPLAHCGRLYS